MSWWSRPASMCSCAEGGSHRRRARRGSEGLSGPGRRGRRAPGRLGQPIAEVIGELEVGAGPPARADERGGDQHDGREAAFGWALSQCLDQDRRTDRVTDHDRPLVEVCHLAPDRGAPRRSGSGHPPRASAGSGPHVRGLGPPAGRQPGRCPTRHGRPRHHLARTAPGGHRSRRRVAFSRAIHGSRVPDTGTHGMPALDGGGRAREARTCRGPERRPAYLPSLVGGRGARSARSAATPHARGVVRPVRCARGRPTLSRGADVWTTIAAPIRTAPIGKAVERNEGQKDVDHAEPGRGVGARKVGETHVQIGPVRPTRPRPR